MLSPRAMVLLFALAVGWFSPALSAQTHVKASLVAADTSVQPGKTITVALRMVHDAHWHTYWINPGTGLPTALEWKLPAGWKAGEVQWPAPQVLKDKTGAVTGNGYEGDVLLPVVITAPADAVPGTVIELKAAASWLMCAEVCMPGDASLSLRLAVSNDAARPDSAWGERIRQAVATLPRALPEWKVTASRTAKTVTLQVTPSGPAAHAPSELHFFAEDNLVGYDLPQASKSDGRGGFILTLQVAPDGPAEAKRLRGILTSANGWLAGGQPRGLAISTDFVAASSPAPSPSAAASAALPAATSPSLAGTLLLAFIGGLILNLMPCVFPVLGIKILGFVNQAGSERRKVVMHGLVFTLGVLLSFWALAAVLAVLRASGDQLGWGFQLQSPAFVYALAILMLVFALNMSGLFEFGLSATGVGGELQTKSGYAGSFFTGILATVVATPCSAPFLAPALGAALAVSTVESFGIFTAIAVGLSTPYLLLSIFPQAVKILPRPGAWMETFKQFMAFPLYATVAYLVWVLAGQASEEGFRDALFGLVMIALAVWVYGRWTAPGASAGRVRFGVIGCAIASVIGLWLGWPRTAAPAAGAAPEVVWEAWSPETVARLRAENRIIYVDFTARWCATCQANKKLVFHSDEVLRSFADKKIATLRADWTNQDPRITAELARYQRSAVPFNVFWIPGRNDPVILPEILTPGIVLDALRQATK